jgi:hypothetical protein
MDVLEGRVVSQVPGGGGGEEEGKGKEGKGKEGKGREPREDEVGVKK